LAGKAPPTVVTAVPAPFTVTETVLPVKLETPQPYTLPCTRKQDGPVVLKLPELPPAAIGVQLPPPDELLLEELLDELEDELELLLEELLELLDELLEDELELLLEELLELLDELEDELELPLEPV
jgi:hypothetical protein